MKLIRKERIVTARLYDTKARAERTITVRSNFKKVKNYFSRIQDLCKDSDFKKRYEITDTEMVVGVDVENIDVHYDIPDEVAEQYRVAAVSDTNELEPPESLEV